MAISKHWIWSCNWYRTTCSHRKVNTVPHPAENTEAQTAPPASQTLSRLPAPATSLTHNCLSHFSASTRKRKNAQIAAMSMKMKMMNWKMRKTRKRAEQMIAWPRKVEKSRVRKQKMEAGRMESPTSKRPKSSIAIQVKKMTMMTTTIKTELTSFTLMKTAKRHRPLTSKKSEISSKNVESNWKLKKHICSISKRCKE